MKPVRLIVTLAALAAAPALAQAPPLGDSARKMIGSWEFSNADRDKTCTATFRSDPTSVGFKVEFDGNCANLFPMVRNVAGWKFPDNDLLFLLDAEGQPLAEFSEVEDGIYEAPTPGVGVLFLQSAAAAGPAPKPAEQMAGTWAIMRGPGLPLCVLTLTSNPAGEAFALALKPGCDVAIVRLNFTQWRIDRDELLLLPARGNTWRFEEVDGKTWRRVPEGTEQITLVRQ